MANLNSNLKTEPAKQSDWITIKSMENMIEFYRKELLGVLKGKKVVNSIPFGTRKRLIEHGILRKFGTRFELTNIAQEILLT